MPIKILIVDDMASVRMYLKMILQDEDVVLSEASDGEQALEQCLGGAPPDIVLLDVLMPRMDGYECCRRIKSAAGGIYVIMVTTRGKSEQREAAFTAGCDDFLTKPIDRTILMEKIRQWLDTQKNDQAR